MVEPGDLCRRLEQVRSVIDRTCQKCGRQAEDVRLIGVTKTLPAETVAAAVECGLQDVGENYIQELRAKVGAVPPVRWHFIGHLQRNKAGIAAELASCVHSLDSLALLRALDQRCSVRTEPLDCLLQVRLGGEASKSGLEPDRLLPLLDETAEDPPRHLRLIGLMTVPPPAENPDDNRPHFRRLRDLLDSVLQQKYSFWQGRELSMGMSDDYTAAIEEGATMIRVGRAIFGPRPPKV